MNGRCAEPAAQGGAGQALLPALRPGLRVGWSTGLRLGVAILALLPAALAGAQPVSPAEVLLFETDHLARIKPPATLVYAFSKQSNVEPAFTDTVQLDVSHKQGQLHAALRFLSGERTHALPEIDDVHGNPVLLGFLERDIAEMKRLTGGAAGYFRKRIRLALANGAQVRPQRISYAGKTVDAKAVHIQPYLDDPLHTRFEQYVRKTYTFVLSDQVPGGVYQVSTTLANAAGSGAASGTAAARRPASGGARPATALAAAHPGVASAAPHPAARALDQPDAAKQRGAASLPGAANQSGAGKPGATTPGASLPVIDETLTLVKVTEPRR